MSTSSVSPSSNTRMNMTELHAKHRTGLPENELVLDVRDTDEYAEGHVPGSRNIPVDEIVERAPSFKGELSRYSRIYVHCGGGGRAGRAADALRAAGLTNIVHIADSGMRSWTAAGFPVTR